MTTLLFACTNGSGSKTLLFVQVVTALLLLSLNGELHQINNREFHKTNSFCYGKKSGRRATYWKLIPEIIAASDAATWAEAVKEWTPDEVYLKTLFKTVERVNIYVSKPCTAGESFTLIEAS